MISKNNYDVIFSYPAFHEFCIKYFRNLKIKRYITTNKKIIIIIINSNFALE